MATVFDLIKAYGLIKSGDVESLRSMVEKADVYVMVEDDDGTVEPAGFYWGTPVGLFFSRSLAIHGVPNDKLNIMQYVCGERGVHPLADCPDAYGFALNNGIFTEQEEKDRLWYPLRAAADLGREEICMYLLSLTGPEDDLNVRWNGMNMCHHAVGNGMLSFLRALAKRGVDLDVRSESGYTPLALAIKTCHMPPVRFLLEHFRAQGREQDVVRDLTAKPPKNEEGETVPLIFSVIQYEAQRGLSNGAKLAMIKFLVQELGIDIWTEGPYSFQMADKDWRPIEGRAKEHHTFLPLHAAAVCGNQPLLDFFITECGMPVDTCTTTGYRLTALHFLVLSDKPEAEILPIVKWLVEKKGADASSAATTARLKGKADIHQYLLAQGKRQAARK